MNRPVHNNQLFGKRPTVQSEQFRNPPKMQRNFHLQTEGNNCNNEYYEEPRNHEGEENPPTLDEYFQNQTEVLEIENQLETQEFVDIHFLDQ